MCIFLHIPLIFNRAANGARTRDPQLGKLMLYQLSYCRKLFLNVGKGNKILLKQTRVFPFYFPLLRIPLKYN